VDFEAYLTSKKIDAAKFRKAEPELWAEWNTEFEQMHPESFTMQKLNLINPIRRKYTLHILQPKKVEPPQTPAATQSAPSGEEVKPVVQSPAKPKPVMAKPVFKPKPKM
jgi:capsular polysaccharide biosynthesis protein